MNGKSPCGKECEERRVGCHASCPKWAAWEVERAQIYAARLMQTQTRGVRSETFERAIREKVRQQKRGRQ